MMGRECTILIRRPGRDGPRSPHGEWAETHRDVLLRKPERVRTHQDIWDGTVGTHWDIPQLSSRFLVCLPKAASVKGLDLRRPARGGSDSATAGLVLFLALSIVSLALSFGLRSGKLLCGGCGIDGVEIGEAWSLDQLGVLIWFRNCFLVRGGKFKPALMWVSVRGYGVLEFGWCGDLGGRRSCLGLSFGVYLLWALGCPFFFQVSGFCFVWSLSIAKRVCVSSLAARIDGLFFGGFCCLKKW
ncbi:hypothetical protein YC2023_010077 [Brassica napus]